MEVPLNLPIPWGHSGLQFSLIWGSGAQDGVGSGSLVGGGLGGGGGAPQSPHS